MGNLKTLEKMGKVGCCRFWVPENPFLWQDISKVLPVSKERFDWRPHLGRNWRSMANPFRFFFPSFFFFFPGMFYFVSNLGIF